MGYGKTRRSEMPEQAEARKRQTRARYRQQAQRKALIAEYQARYPERPLRWISQRIYLDAKLRKNPEYYADRWKDQKAFLTMRKYLDQQSKVVELRGRFRPDVPPHSLTSGSEYILAERKRAA